MYNRFTLDANHREIRIGAFVIYLEEARFCILILIYWIFLSSKLAKDFVLRRANQGDFFNRQQIYISSRVKKCH